MKLVCILWLCLIINSTYGRRNAFNSTNKVESIFATWADFQTRHIVSNDQGSAANWNAYFRLHMPSQYGNKSVNTFVVNSINSIANNFPSDVPQYTGGSAINLYWSSTEQHIFVLTLSGSPGQLNPYYNVYDCGQKYYVAGLDMLTRLPVHYQGQSATQGPRLDPITAGCLRVNRQDLFCRVDETLNTNCIVVMVTGTVLGLVILAILVVAVFGKFKSLRGNTTTNEYSPLIGNSGRLPKLWRFQNPEILIRFPEIIIFLSVFLLIY